MPKFFIDRPVFAWVVAILISLVGAIAVSRLGIASYPNVAPPQITVTATYPGASAETMETTVTQVIEQQLIGLDNLLYFSSTSRANGTATITLSFATGTNPDTAAVQVQNKVQLAQPLLPSQVTQQGVVVAKASPDILMFMQLISDDPTIDSGRLNDIIASRILPVIARIDGVGSTITPGSEYAMRLWLNPDKLQAYGLSASQVLTAVQAQNAQFGAGSLGADPAAPGQEVTATAAADTLFTSPQQFRDIILRANNDGTVVRLSDVARVEFGPQTYGQRALLDGKPAGGLGINLAPGANALQVGETIKKQMDLLVRDLPGVRWTVAYDTTPFITASITEVVKTLFEAIVLVFLVMLVFLQNLRATLIPTLVIPVALLGTFAGMQLLGFSLNQLTLFGMVLAIGIVVDDAIVVIENVERLMTEEGLEPREATRKSMGQITGAIVAITVVLTAVFVPSALQPGATGIIYAQFAFTIALSMACSAFLAMTFTPALCATLLKPTDHARKNALFRGFDRLFDWVARTYNGHVGWALRHAPRWMLAFVLVTVLTGFLYARMPTGFVPGEDQGSVLVSVTLPPGATLERNDRVMAEIRERILKSPVGASVDAIFQAQGFGFAGNAENAGTVFVKLKPWEQRSKTAMELIPEITRALRGLPDAQAIAFNQPAIRGLSQLGGIDMFLQARAGQSRAELAQASRTLVEKAGQNPTLSGIRPNVLPDAPQWQIAVDRAQAYALGLTLTDVYNGVAMLLAPTNVNQFRYDGRIKRVYMQADAPFRMGPEALDRVYTPSTLAGSAGAMVPLSSVVKAQWGTGPIALQRFNGNAAVQIVGNPAPGTSTGQAMATLQDIVRNELPPGFGYDWNGLSYQEQQAGNSATLLLVLSVVVVFLCLAALYESWSIPVAVLLVVPLGMLGVIAFCWLAGFPNDVFFKISLVTVMGLAAKNAILIVEFAVEAQQRGLTLYESVLEAARLRLRPILMTSLAFILGVFPLIVSSGAGAVSRHEIGMGVTGGMLFATFLGLLMIPVFYVVVRRVLGDKLDQPSRKLAKTGTKPETGSMPADEAADGVRP
ncbi:multidrug efflux pump [Variovorax sp. YR750]|uniref:efflux RND transporter permease subunit n=1 Tax=Variovorax sp. YR750 TaxID=1884384 RepID=UPI0008CD5B80|nr:efflux RND transporter permease subunit [Variovorax sp. YR750]SEL66471.1 multidrug efflux pump [Variovorax sp. YR750]